MSTDGDALDCGGERRAELHAFNVEARVYPTSVALSHCLVDIDEDGWIHYVVVRAPTGIRRLDSIQGKQARPLLVMENVALVAGGEDQSAANRGGHEPARPEKHQPR